MGFARSGFSSVSTAVSRQEGFSLLELLATLTILAMVASIAFVIGGSNDQRRVQKQLDQLRGQLDLASEESRARNINLGLRFYRQGQSWNYQWLQFQPTEQQPRQWLALNQLIDYLNDGSLNSKVGIDSAELETVTANSLGQVQNAPKAALRPHMIFFPSGETSGLDMEFTLEQSRWQLNVSSLGRAELAQLNSDGKAISKGLEQ